jgi:hypothetical protein
MVGFRLLESRKLKLELQRGDFTMSLQIVRREMTILTTTDWHARRAAHEARARPWVEPRLRRMSLGERHPVEDFLFEYYPYRPGQLLRWHPGLGVILENGEDYLSHKGYGEAEHGVTADPRTLPAARVQSLRWLRDMLARTAGRTAALGCFGLHEWAMVYRTESVRHEKWPFRLTPDEIARVVEEQGPRCTHYDALRFFTPAARPLNKYQPNRETTADFEQPGCLHANMDLYKWAFKLSPFSSSELVADCFELARDIRVLDMEASPYDFSALGLTPVCIETPEGRAEYELRQRAFARRAAPLRQQLLILCDAVITAATLQPVLST